MSQQEDEARRLRIALDQQTVREILAKHLKGPDCCEIHKDLWSVLVAEVERLKLIVKLAVDRREIDSSSTAELVEAARNLLNRELMRWPPSSIPPGYPDGASAYNRKDVDRLKAALEAWEKPL